MQLSQLWDAALPIWQTITGSQTAIAVISFAAGIIFKTVFEKFSQHRLDIKLEAMKSSQRRGEEALRASLQEKGQEIASLRGGALATLIRRHETIETQRLQAIYRTWERVDQLARLKMLAKMVARLKMETALELSAKKDQEGSDLREFAEALMSSFGIDKEFKIEIPSVDRLFLSPLAWALLSTYKQLILAPIGHLMAMKIGFGRSIIDPTQLQAAVRLALPHQSDFLNKWGLSGALLLVDELEEALFQELERSLRNPDADQQNLAQVKAILRAIHDKSGEEERDLSSIKAPAKIVRSDITGA